MGKIRSLIADILIRPSTATSVFKSKTNACAINFPWGRLGEFPAFGMRRLQGPSAGCNSPVRGNIPHFKQLLRHCRPNFGGQAAIPNPTKEFGENDSNGANRIPAKPLRIIDDRATVIIDPFLRAPFSI